MSTLADAVILLRYVEQAGQIRRTLTVLKMRGGPHDRGVHELTISDEGFTLGGVMTSPSGVITGIATTETEPG